ncbi:MAG: septal ring lytic transglycosylase RlpA family protein [Alphaproteobacteria bacterium]|nr:septal ring lytic transglycosylase RlpA family protein [Alphaproteobacteria bacterium]
MMKYILMLTTAIALTGCTSSGSLFESWEDDAEVNTADTTIPNGSMYKVEKPYEINNVWYFPQENYSYKEQGRASWYMPVNGGVAKTANGEDYIATEMTARHKTLPLPSIVKITNLDNGKSIVARVNDRGPMVNNRLIDVSQKAAEALGLPVTGTSMVEVEVMPQESQAIRDALLAAGRVYTENSVGQDLSIVPPMPVPQQEVQQQQSPAVVYAPSEPIYTEKTPTQAKPIVTGGTYIQLGAYGNAANASAAERVAGRVGQVATKTKVQGGRTLSVVQAGPYENRAAAEQALRQLKQMGYRDAFIVK